MAPRYEIHIATADLLINSLDMGGKSPAGEQILVNDRYLTLNGRPWLPVMGEFHFSRYPREGWRDELLKLKAGGINVVATYIFWNHIEEVEGKFDWTGQRDLRNFIQLCGEVGLYAYPRLGPWAHGECRNGGFPDWLLEKCGDQLRMDAPLYLKYARRLYEQIAHQLHGLLWKDGGPVIGVQIENELLNNAAHIRTLKQLAVEVGIDVPMYTMTGWGPAEAPDGDVIPVFGGYPDAFWDRQVESWSRPSRKHYFFSSLRDDNTIGADLTQRSELGDLSYQNRYPYGTCETGGGMQVSYHRRPSISAEDIAAIALVKVGSGSNLQGYYMYHGGANPGGKLSTLNESQKTGYPNDLPVVNYDFQAPIGQYGQVRQTYFALRPLHLFLQDFGALLAPSPLTLPEDQPKTIDDLQTLRWAVRSDGVHGFLFVNNYQRVEHLGDHAAVQFVMKLPAETIQCPSKPVNIAANQAFIWPFNLDISGARLKYASAQLICRLVDSGSEGDVYVFHSIDSIECELAFDRTGISNVHGPCDQTIQGDTLVLDAMVAGTDCLIHVTTVNGAHFRILVLTQQQSRQVLKAHIHGQDRVLLSPETLLIDQETIRVQYRVSGNSENIPEIPIAVFPGFDSLADSAGTKISSHPDGVFTRYLLRSERPTLEFEAVQIQPAGPAQPVRIGPFGVAQAPEDDAYDRGETWKITIQSAFHAQVQEPLLSIRYIADAARAYLNGRLIDDDFFHGRSWEIGLRRFLPEIQGSEIILRFLPLQKDAPIYLPENCTPDYSTSSQVSRVDKINLDAICEMKLIVI